ncbi:MAG: hypothetical protein AAGF76_08345 [Pseudomonadota bacterium]
MANSLSDLSVGYSLAPKATEADANPGAVDVFASMIQGLTDGQLTIVLCCITLLLLFIGGALFDLTTRRWSRDEAQHDDDPRFDERAELNAALRRFRAER